jgi:hypothetical protein
MPTDACRFYYECTGCSTMRLFDQQLRYWWLLVIARQVRNSNGAKPLELARRLELEAQLNLEVNCLA